MVRSVFAVILWCLALLVSGCSRNADEWPDDRTFLVNLDLSVEPAEIAAPRSRVTDADPVTDDEKIRTLRIIVVRPDGTVEANRFVRRTKAVTYAVERFKVIANETKRIYLFVNEDNTVVETTEGETVSAGGKLFNYLSHIETGEAFPADELASLVIRLKDDSAQLSGALPMNESHEIAVGDTDSRFALFVTRAAVKFTYRITNNNDRDLLLTGLTIDKMARKEYYMPHGAEYRDNADGIKEIVSYEAAESEYYTFAYTDETASGTGIRLPQGKTVELPRIYLLEGKYTDPYAMSLTINGLRQDRFFPALPQLPRNTHVVININIRKDATVHWEADVVPYETVPPLEPEFGL